MVAIAAFLAAVFAYSLVSGRLKHTMISPPLFFAAGGACTALALQLGSTVDAFGGSAPDRGAFLLLAELGLVMTLFTDAARLPRGALKGRPNLPVRLLSIGMLGSIALGAVLAMIVFADLTWWQAGILAAILAPTDAGLGQAIVSSPRVPRRIREALNVEAGLNDGLAVPFLLFFMAMAAAGGTDALGQGTLARFVIEQLLFGTLIGVGCGLIGGQLLESVRRNGWMDDGVAQLGVLALPLACVLAAEATAASMFIAAFVAGLATRTRFREVGRHAVEFTHGVGELFNFLVFFLFGFLVVRDLAQFDAQVAIYALLSLTLVRMLPVALAMRGTGLSRPTVLFMGWFGPRGLASIVLALVYLEQSSGVAVDATLRAAVMATVLSSIVAHGISTVAGIARYQESVTILAGDAPERRDGT